MLALALIVLGAFVVEATAGFGATVITVTLASHIMPVPEVLAALVPVNMVLSAYFVIRYRQDVDWPLVVRRGLMQMGIGVAVGMVLYRLHGARWLALAFAALVMTLSASELWRLRRAEAHTSAPLSQPRALAALFGAGVIHGVFACGGPLLVYVVGRELGDKGRFRATLSAVWLLLNGALLVNMGSAGNLTRASLERSAVLLLCLALGVALGERVHARIREDRFRLAVFALLFFAGASLFARTLGT